jgi:sec-independent protein translocase protein TatB
MLFDFGWSEILLIGVVALVFIGPKDLPKALRVAGYWVRKARTLSREFQSSIDQMIREAELDEMREDLKKAAEFDLDREFRNTIDPTGSLAEDLKPPTLPSFSSAEQLPPPPSAAEAEVEAPPVPAPAPPAASSAPGSAPVEPGSAQPGPEEPGPEEPGPEEPGPVQPRAPGPAPMAGTPPGGAALHIVPPGP